MLSDACRVGDGGVRGRCLLAARDVAAGELLASCTPAALVAYTASGACDACLAKDALRCGRCGHAAYCSAACEATAAHAASGECATFAQAAALQGGAQEDLPHRFALRLLCRVARRDVAAAELRALAAPPPPASSADAEALRTLAERLLAACHAEGVKPEMTAADVAQLLCGVRCNAHSLYDDDGSEDAVVGAALVLSGAQLANHACRPSAEFYNVGATVHVRALVDVAAGDEISVGYVGLEAPAQQRRAQLVAQYGFHCDCARCVEEAQQQQHAPQQAAAPPVNAADWRAVLAHASAQLATLDAASARPGRATSAALLRARTAGTLLDRHAAWRRALAQPRAALAARFGDDAAASQPADAPPPHAVALAVEAAEIEASAEQLLAPALEVLRIARGAEHAICVALQARLLALQQLSTRTHPHKTAADCGT